MIDKLPYEIIMKILYYINTDILLTKIFLLNKKFYDLSIKTINENIINKYKNNIDNFYRVYDILFLSPYFKLCKERFEYKIYYKEKLFCTVIHDKVYEDNYLFFTHFESYN